MYGASSAFATAITDTHSVVCKLEVYKPSTAHGVMGDRVYSTGDVSVSGLLEGSVTESRNGATRRQCDFSVLLGSYSMYQDIFDPKLGYDIYLYRGIKYTSGAIEYVPLGVFRGDTAALSSRKNGVMATITGYDYSYWFSQNKFGSSFYVATGTAAATAIAALYSAKAPFTRWATTDLNIISTAYTYPSMNFSDKDNPWESMTKMAEAVEAEAYYDQLGLLNIVKVIDPQTVAPVADLSSGTIAIRTGQLTRNTQVTQTYNGVIVRSTAPWLLLPVVGSAWDLEPFSPTYRYGPFGERPELIEDAMVTSGSQANAVALARYNKIVGATEEVQFTMFPDPRYDVGDVATLRDPLLGVYDQVMFETLTIPLMSGEMSGTVRLGSRRKL